MAFLPWVGARDLRAAAESSRGEDRLPDLPRSPVLPGRLRLQDVVDWSTIGRLGPHGKPVLEKDADGFEIYDSKKGDFLWEKHTDPEHRWFNGTVLYTLLEGILIVAAQHLSVIRRRRVRPK